MLSSKVLPQEQYREGGRNQYNFSFGLLLVYTANICAYEQIQEFTIYLADKEGGSLCS